MSQQQINAGVLFSDRLAEKLKVSGLKKGDLAAKVGVHPPALSRWLKGSIPEAAHLSALAAELNTSVQFLLTGGEVSDNRLREEASSGYTAGVVPASRDTSSLLNEARTAVQNGITSGRVSYFKLALEILDELSDHLMIGGMRARTLEAVKNARDAEDVRFTPNKIRP